MRVAIYCRVSKEDEEKGQSESITNQKKSLLKYVQEKNWQIVDCYLDDGYSGTNFQRPGFQRMIADIKKGLVNCVITKDYSRLGREHVQTSNYTEIFFPQNGVRYIAVNDGIDTLENDDFLGFRAVFNDMYARDISKKIRFTLRNKQKEGAFIGAFAPYGYQKNPENKNQLIIEPAEASIVQEIFQLYLKGYGKSRIASYLNNQGIPSPASSKNLISRTNLWNPIAIKRILENEVYLGHILQHKREKISYKVKKQISLPKEHWFKVKNTHPPIIEKEVFELVQKEAIKRKKGFAALKRDGYLFTGLVKCGLCGDNYVYCNDKKQGKILICGRYKRYYTKGCEKRSLKEEVLEKAVLSDLRVLIEKGINKEALLAKLASKTKSASISLKDELEAKLAETEKKINLLYQDRLNGLIADKQFLLFKKRLDEKISYLQERITFTKNSREKTPKQYNQKLVESILSLKKLCRTSCLKLIKKIEIVSLKKIKIHYQFKPPF